MRTLIILFGAPGSGKGLLGDVLIQKTDLLKVSTGDIFRSEIKRQTDLGISIAGLVKSGRLVDDFIVNSIVSDALFSTSRNILLDGYPRNLSQFENLRCLTLGWFCPICVYLNAPLPAIMDRIKERRICEICGTTHFASNGCCPKCGGRSIMREDDKLFAKRMRDYQTTTEPLLGRICAWSQRFIVVDALNIEESQSLVLKFLGY